MSHREHERWCYSRAELYETLCTDETNSSAKAAKKKVLVK